MTYAHRPTTGNTYAIGRFSPDGPEGYAPVYSDGTHGPTYATRDEAEADYARKESPMTTARYIIQDSNAEETILATRDRLADAQEFAHKHADSTGRKVYIAWSSESRGTVCQPIEPRGTAEALETFAANDRETYQSYFLPLARCTEKRYRKNRNKAIEYAQKTARNLTAFAVVRFDREAAKCGWDFIRFDTDTQREAADSIGAYIVNELDAGNSWL